MVWRLAILLLAAKHCSLLEEAKESLPEGGPIGTSSGSDSFATPNTLNKLVSG